MERSSFPVIIGSHASVVFVYGLLNALHAEAVPLSIWSGRGNPIPWQKISFFVKRIGKAGIEERDDYKGCFGAAGDADFHIAVRNPRGCFHCIVKQVAEKRSHIRTIQKSDNAAADIRVKGNFFLSALSLIAAQDGVQQLVVAHTGAFLQVRGGKKPVDVSSDFVLFPLFVEQGNRLKMLLDVMEQNVVVFRFLQKHFIIFRKIRLPLKLYLYIRQLRFLR